MQLAQEFWHRREWSKYAGGNGDQPVVVLGSESEQEMLALCYEAGADSYVCISNATTS